MIVAEYAKAIYELALEEKKEELFKSLFEFVLDTLKDKEFYLVLTSPFIQAKKKEELIGKVYGTLDETFQSFLKVLVQKNRMSIFKDIYDCFSKLMLEHKDIVKIQIYSAVELNSMQMIHLTEALQQKYAGKKIELENILDSKLIGGIHIISNGESIDMSLKNSLDKLRESL